MEQADDNEENLENDPIEEPEEPEEAEDDGIPDAVRRRLEAFIPELVRKTFAAGMGAVFTTEEGLRKLTKEMPFPKDVASYVANTAGATKDEVMRVMAREVGEFLQTINFSEEIAKMLTMLSFEIKTEIRFIPNDEKFGGVEPDVKSSVRLKKKEDEQDKDNEDEEDEDGPKTTRRRRLTRRGQNRDES